jgi:hypothetical protein
MDTCTGDASSASATIRQLQCILSTSKRFDLEGDAHGGSVEIESETKRRTSVVTARGMHPGHSEVAIACASAKLAGGCEECQGCKRS